MAENSQTEYDVVVIGSGAGGGMSAYVLAEAGVKVLMLEAGRDYDPVSETPMFNTYREAPLRGVGTPDKEFGFYDATVDGGWHIPGEPYRSADGTQFMWWRSRMLGGRTNHWARNSFRMGPYDFKPYTRDGLGVDWPVSYDDIAPYYDKTEKLVGVYGARSGLENHPDSSPGVLHKPPRPRVGEMLIQAASKDLNIPCVPAHRAVLTRDMGERSACFYATRCVRGCSIGAAFQTTTSLLPMARKTGNLTIVTDAMVYEILVGRDGKASGVLYINKNNGEIERVNARAVVMAASAGETARIMLNSKNRYFPDGVANSSGQVGRNLMDTVGATVRGQIPALEGRPSYNEDGAMGMHVYIPFWQYGEQARGDLSFPRSYHMEVNGRGKDEPRMSLGGIADYANSYGAALKADMRRYYGSFISFAMRGEMIPNDHSYCEIDTDQKDKWGIPTLRFSFGRTDHEINMVAHFKQHAGDIIKRMGGRVLDADKTPLEMISKGGEIIHEVGTARMGSDAKHSVTNQYGQAWDIKNLFICDGAIFASKAHKNPTLTILALAWRNSEYLVEQMRMGNL